MHVHSVCVNMCLRVCVSVHEELAVSEASKHAQLCAMLLMILCPMQQLTNGQEDAARKG